MSRPLRSKKPAAGERTSKPPPSWFVQPSSSSEEESIADPESLNYWKDFELPDYLCELMTFFEKREFSQETAIYHDTYLQNTVPGTIHIQRKSPP